MIGRRPYLFSGLAALLLAGVVLDVSSTFHAPAYQPGDAIGTWLHNGLGSMVAFVSHLGVADWILVAIAALLPLWAWTRARAFATLGTINISEFTTDEDDKLRKIAARAALQHELGERGWLPASGVPSGSPSVAAIADVISKSPVPEAGWIGSLLGLVRWPPAATGFNINGTLVGSESSVQLAYELVCTGPRPSVTLGRVPRSPEAKCDETKTIAGAAKVIFIEMTQAAGAMYPEWARWSDPEAMTHYHDGLATETQTEHRSGAERVPHEQTNGAALGRYGRAISSYQDAREIDPDNLLALLRIANCQERLASAQLQQARELLKGTGPEPDAGEAHAAALALHLTALDSYLTVRLAEPTIFEAGFRISVVMSVLTSYPPELLAGNATLAKILRRLDEDTARELDPDDRADSSRARRLLIFLIDPQSRRARRAARRSPAGTAEADTADVDAASTKDGRPAIVARLEKMAQRESRYARRRLRWWWTIVRENRFRHRFEPSGTERRQLLKALGLSRMAQRARHERSQRDVRPDGSPAPGMLRRTRSNAKQLCWQAWVCWRYMFGRHGVAGSQAHYNAACFYALLPQADGWAPFGSLRIRKRALRHLRYALRDPRNQLPRRYVLDEDPDLNTLRELSHKRFTRVAREVAPFAMGPAGFGVAAGPVLDYCTVTTAREAAAGPIGERAVVQASSVNSTPAS